MPSRAASEGEATVVFMRPGGMGASTLDLHLLAVVDGELEAIGDLKRHHKITRQFPAGAQRFVAYSTGQGLGGQIESYLEAALEAGRIYYVAARFQLERGIELVPFKANSADPNFSLMSERLRRSISTMVESETTLALDPNVAARVRKALPRLERESASFRAKSGDTYTLLPGDWMFRSTVAAKHCPTREG